LSAIIREITHVKRMILESESEMCKQSMELGYVLCIDILPNALIG